MMGGNFITLEMLVLMLLGTSHTISSFAVNTALFFGISLVAPIAHNALNRFLDYAAYKWNFWRGLRDSGGVAQTDQLRSLATSAGDIKDSIELIESKLLPLKEQKEALSVPLKLVSDAIENGHANSLQTNALLAQAIEEIQQNGKNSERTINLLAQLQQNIVAQNSKLTLSIQKEQKEMNQNFITALTSFTKALQEIKS